MQGEEILLLLELPVKFFKCLLPLLSNAVANDNSRYTAISLLHPSGWLLQLCLKGSI